MAPRFYVHIDGFHVTIPRFSVLLNLGAWLGSLLFQLGMRALGGTLTLLRVTSSRSHLDSCHALVISLMCSLPYMALETLGDSHGPILSS